jgi:hypothetical protein
MSTQLRGATLLRSKIANYLSTAVPLAIDVMRSQQGLTALQLPYPVRYDATDPYAVDDWPAMGAYITADRGHTRRDFGPAAEREYSVIYTTRFFAAVQTPLDTSGEFVNEDAHTETVRLRDDMAAVLRIVLLNSPSLGGFDIEVLEESITTDYREPMMVNDKMRNVFLASVTLSADVTQTETLFLEPLGTADTINVHPESVGWSEEL